MSNEVGWILLVCGPDAPRAVELPSSGVVVIGRAREGFTLTLTEVVLADAAVSPRHAQLVLGAQSTLEDLGSDTGTTLAGARVDGRVALAVDQAIGIGPFTLTLHPARIEIDDPELKEPSPLIVAIARDLPLVAIRAGDRVETLARALHALSGRPHELQVLRGADLATAAIPPRASLLVTDVVPTDQRTLMRLAELDVAFLVPASRDDTATYCPLLVLSGQAA